MVLNPGDILESHRQFLNQGNGLKPDIPILNWSGRALSGFAFFLSSDESNMQPGVGITSSPKSPIFTEAIRGRAHKYSQCAAGAVKEDGAFFQVASSAGDQLVI